MIKETSYGYLQNQVGVYALLNFSGGHHFLKRLAPNKIAIMKSARKTKNRTLAMDAAPSAMPPNPKMAAIIAITKKMTDQRNIVVFV